jgi:hypothetical protein
MWIELTRRRVVAYFHRDLLWDAIGNWFSQADIERVANDAGFDVEFRDSSFYGYRFHALLTPKPAQATPQPVETFHSTQTD